jgi:hypothetical protein
MVIEGVGRTNPAASGVICYHDESRTYRLRAFNDGRFLETTTKLF